MKMRKSWSEYLWIASAIYLFLGFFNILFAWIGMICFLVPLLISITGGGKIYCNKYCGRGQLLNLLGDRFKLCRYKTIPRFISSKYFRYGFLIFFLSMFGSMIFNTYLVLKGAQSLNQVVTILWTWKLPWNFVEVGNVTPWVAQFAFGFYSLMLTSTLLGLITMIIYKPRSWCVYCPMGTMTQGISIIREKIRLNK